MEDPGSFPSDISPGTVAEDPASGTTPAHGTEPDQRIKTMQGLMYLNTELPGIVSADLLTV